MISMNVAYVDQNDYLVRSNNTCPRQRHTWASSPEILLCCTLFCRHCQHIILSTVAMNMPAGLPLIVGVHSKITGGDTQNEIIVRESMATNVINKIWDKARLLCALYFYFSFQPHRAKRVFFWPTKWCSRRLFCFCCELFKYLKTEQVKVLIWIWVKTSLMNSMSRELHRSWLFSSTISATLHRQSLSSSVIICPALFSDELLAVSIIMSILVTASLPDSFLDSLKQFNDVRVRDGEIPIFELVDSRYGNSAFLDFPGNESEAGPLLYPTFGNPLNPYVSPLAQIEVFNLLATFQPLKSQDLVANVFPFIVAQFPVMGGFQYHHTMGSIQSVQVQIQIPTRFEVSCPGLCATPNGNIICDLSIMYANAAVVIRIHRSAWPQSAWSSLTVSDDLKSTFRKYAGLSKYHS